MTFTIGLVTSYFYSIHKRLCFVFYLTHSVMGRNLINPLPPSKLKKKKKTNKKQLNLKTRTNKEPKIQFISKTQDSRHRPGYLKKKIECAYKIFLRIIGLHGETIYRSTGTTSQHGSHDSPCIVQRVLTSSSKTHYFLVYLTTVEVEPTRNYYPPYQKP